MHKNVQTNPEKSQKLAQHSCCSMLTLGKKLKAIGGTGYRFLPKGETFPTETIRLVVTEALVCEKLIPKPAQMGQYFYHDMPFHDIMSSFMNFR